MSYTKTNWSNNVAPALNATNLNKIEQGIYDAHDKLDGITDTVTDVVFDHDVLGRSVLKKTVKDNDTGESTVTKMVVPGDGDTRYTFDTQNSSRGEFRVSSSDSEDEPYQVMIKDGDKLADKDVVAELGAHNLVNITIQSQTIGGITVTNNGDGTVTVNGTNSSGNDLYIKLCDVVIKSGVYFLSGCPEGGETGKCLQFNSIQPYIAPIQDKGNGAYFNTSNQATQTVPLYIAVWENVTVDNWTFRPMVSYYYASREFHPYVMTNRDITDALDDMAELGAHNLIKVSSETAMFNTGTFTNNGDGTITINGTNTSDSGMAFIVGKITLKPGYYFLSGCPVGGSLSTYYLYFAPNIQPYTATVKDMGDGVAFKVENTQTTRLFIYLASGQTVNNLTFRPMVRYFNSSQDFHPYAMTNRDITDALSYSTAERVVGYWLDGKPIYQKTFSLSSLNCVANNWTQTSISRGSMEMIIDISALIESSTPSVHKGLSGGFINDYVAINSFRTFGTDTGDVAYVTIQYIKTTD